MGVNVVNGRQTCSLKIHEQPPIRLRAVTETTPITSLSGRCLGYVLVNFVFAGVSARAGFADL